MSSYEIGPASRAILDAALADLRAEVDRTLTGCGASEPEKERVRRAFAPVTALVRGTVTVSMPSAEEIERRRIEVRGGNVLSLGTRIKRLRAIPCGRRTDQEYAAAGDEPEGAA